MRVGVSVVALSARLSRVAGFIPEGARLVDVGTDHAFLPIALVQSGRIPSAIACDVAAGPVGAARENVRRYGLDDRVKIRQGDGLSPIRPGEVDVAVISGLGGWTITGILRRSPAVVAALNRVVLQPMNAGGEVRRFLRDQGFGIWDEALLEEDGRFYQVIAFDRAVCPNAVYAPWSLEDRWLCEEYGPLLLRRSNSLVRRWLSEERQRLARVHQRVGQAVSAEARLRREALALQLAAMDRWLTGGKSCPASPDRDNRAEHRAAVDGADKDRAAVDGADKDGVDKDRADGGEPGSDPGEPV
ncbi:class I SAM-dependent methyltransferase [Alicyclobacillus sp.]|uniref:tRNA (adenine(22)-N(1))-methyltransferase n=1 Tax=Alicyclobacillus sp. TaxID=61169 RepID=UPI0025C6A80B|nr:class I SAM-dependent methyltransferase [Alicyclobacillus sp.]MCL6516367.1 class I SAM-dependent methyltransferase [Alicyclobacillus sp.]